MSLIMNYVTLFTLYLLLCGVVVECSFVKSAERKSSDQTYKMITIKGKIIFRNGAPNSIPDGSTLTVSFQDTSMMDAPAVDLGKTVQNISGYRNGDELSYEIKTSQRPEMEVDGSLSAVLNINWTPSGDEWIRPGDYLSDTHHELGLSRNVSEYNKDIEVAQYN